MYSENKTPFEGTSHSEETPIKKIRVIIDMQDIKTTDARARAGVDLIKRLHEQYPEQQIEILLLNDDTHSLYVQAKRGAVNQALSGLVPSDRGTKEAMKPILDELKELIKSAEPKNVSYMIVSDYQKLAHGQMEEPDTIAITPSLNLKDKDDRFETLFNKNFGGYKLICLQNPSLNEKLKPGIYENGFLAKENVEESILANINKSNPMLSTSIKINAPVEKIRVIVDVQSIIDGYGHPNASIKLIKKLRAQYGNIPIEIIPTHDNIALAVKHSSPQEANNSITAVPLQLARNQERLKPVYDQLNTMIESDPNLSFIKIGDYKGILDRKKSPNTVAITAAFDRKQEAELENYFRCNFGADKFICMQPMGWQVSSSAIYNQGKKIDSLDNFLPPIDMTLPSAKEPQETTTPQPRNIIMYKTFTPKNVLQEASKKALMDLNKQAGSEGVTYNVAIYIDGDQEGEEVRREIAKYPNLKFSIRQNESHEQFVDTISQADLVITEGQNSAWEAIQMGIPVIHAPLPNQGHSVQTVLTKIDESLNPIAASLSAEYRRRKTGSDEIIYNFDRMKQEAYIAAHWVREQPTLDNVLRYEFQASNLMLQESSSPLIEKLRDTQQEIISTTPTLSMPSSTNESPLIIRMAKKPESKEKEETQDLKKSSSFSPSPNGNKDNDV